MSNHQYSEDMVLVIFNVPLSNNMHLAYAFCNNVEYICTTQAYIEFNKILP